MPWSAIAGELVDAVKSLAEIPDYFLKFINTHPVLKSFKGIEEPNDGERTL